MIHREIDVEMRADMAFVNETEIFRLKCDGAALTLEHSTGG